jgi:hypothetical protein
MESNARRLGRAVAIACATLPLALPALAQSDAERIRELERRLEKSVQLIEQLTARVNQLEGARAPVPQATPAASPTAAATDAQVREQAERIDSLERSVAQAADAAARNADTGLPLHGFADVSYDHSTRASQPKRSGFALGNLDFYLTPTFGDRVKTLAELNFEVDENGGVATDLERLQLGYTVSDALTAWMGRFHTPYGYWNTAFHHGTQLQTAATRPRFIDFEDRGGILPAHSVGLWLTGRVAAGGGRVEYDGYLANGTRVEGGVLDFNAFHDDNSHKAVGGRLGYAFNGALDGLTLGLHGLSDELNIVAGGVAADRVHLGMFGGYAVYDAHEWEGIAEYYRFRDKAESGPATHSSWAAFWQVGRTFDDRWTPYARWEKAALDKTDPYFASLEAAQSYTRALLGIRYNINPKAAVKLEAGRTREPASQESFTEARAQFAIRF